MKPEEMFHQVGRFEPAEAKKLLAAFEARGIPFEVETDDSALARPERSLKLYFGMYPEGSKIVVFVLKSSLQDAEEILKELFPI